MDFVPIDCTRYMVINHVQGKDILSLYLVSKLFQTIISQSKQELIYRLIREHKIKDIPTDLLFNSGLIYCLMHNIPKERIIKRLNLKNTTIFLKYYWHKLEIKDIKYAIKHLPQNVTALLLYCFYHRNPSYVQWSTELEIINNRKYRLLIPFLKSSTNGKQTTILSLIQFFVLYICKELSIVIRREMNYTLTATGHIAINKPTFYCLYSLIIIYVIFCMKYYFKLINPLLLNIFSILPQNNLFNILYWFVKIINYPICMSIIGNLSILNIHPMLKFFI